MNKLLQFALLIIFVLLNTVTIFGQVNASSTLLQAPLLATEPTKKMVAAEPIWNEEIESRTLYSSTYYSDDGQIKIINSLRPINYYNSLKELVPINPNIEQDEHGNWSALQQPYPTFLNKNGSFTITADNGRKITFGKNCSINDVNINSNMNITNNTIEMSNVSPGIDKEIVFRENGMKYSYVIDSPLSLQENLIFSEELELPCNYTIQEDNNQAGYKTSIGWTGALIIRNPSGDVVSTIHPPICFDDQGNHTIAAYQIEKRNRKYVLNLVVLSDWLNAPERSYPVVIDPIVTGPTGNWTGGSMPSCMIPTFNQDSIQVTIPAGVTVTELNITASFYADPFTTAVMGDGAMSFSTDCDQSQTFTITGANANTAGTAYLDYFNLFNPLTCCFPESCNAQSFYLSMHLGRSALGAGCNTTYIRYDPVTTSWPFQAVIIGKTPESYGGQWSVSPVPICSNQCTIDGTGYVYYGVAPYTFTHPWSNDTITQGQNIGCANGANSHTITLNIPNCPSYCDENFTSLAIPPPTIIDACGVAVVGLPTTTVPIKMSPNITATYDTLICSEQDFIIDIASCIDSADLYWEGVASWGTSDIISTASNTTTGITSDSYWATSSFEGCYSDTIDFSISFLPLPSVDFSNEPDPIVSGLEVVFTDLTIFHVGSEYEWYWDLGDNEQSQLQNPAYTFLSPGEQNICLTVLDDAGCQDSICKLIPVVPAEIDLPNVVTPNNDGVNDLLVFNYLEFYPENELYIFNRWGNLVYQTSGYTNDWNGEDFTEGTYFYLLKLTTDDIVHNGPFQLIK